MTSLIYCIVIQFISLFKNFFFLIIIICYFHCTIHPTGKKRNNYIFFFFFFITLHIFCKIVEELLNSIAPRATTYLNPHSVQKKISIIFISLALKNLTIAIFISGVTATKVQNFKWNLGCVWYHWIGILKPNNFFWITFFFVLIPRKKPGTGSNIFYIYIVRKQEYIWHWKFKICCKFFKFYLLREYTRKCEAQDYIDKFATFTYYNFILIHLYYILCINLFPELLLQILSVRIDKFQHNLICLFLIVTDPSEIIFWIYLQH